MKPETQRAGVRARIRNSIHERARHFVRRRRLEHLARDLGLQPSCGMDVETAETLATVRAHLKVKVNTLIDVGAHIGGFAEPASRVLGVQQVVCFEPILSLHDRMRSRLAGTTFRIIGCALGDQPGTGVLHAHADPSMNSLLPSDGEILARDFDTYDHRRIDRVAVPVDTLDRSVAELDLPTPFFLKLDTQGTELRVLHGASQTLQKTSAVLVEHMFTTPYLQSTKFSDLVAFMAECRFECSAVTHITRRSTHRVSAVDLLFCRNAASA